MRSDVIQSWVAELEAERARIDTALTTLQSLVATPPGPRARPVSPRRDSAPPARAPARRRRTPRTTPAPTRPASNRATVTAAFDQAVLAYVKHSRTHAALCAEIQAGIHPRPSLSRVWSACQRLVGAGLLRREQRKYHLVASAVPPRHALAPQTDVVWNGQKSRDGQLLTNAVA